MSSGFRQEAGLRRKEENIVREERERGETNRRCGAHI